MSSVLVVLLAGFNGAESWCVVEIRFGLIMGESDVVIASGQL
jgi:hypothetical protein